MDCDLSHLPGVMEKVVEMTGANKKNTPSEKKDTFTRNDPTKTKEDGKPKDPIQKERVPTCWNCGESGHRSNECTKPKTKLTM